MAHHYSCLYKDLMNMLLLSSLNVIVRTTRRISDKKGNDPSSPLIVYCIITPKITYETLISDGAFCASLLNLFLTLYPYNTDPVGLV